MKGDRIPATASAHPSSMAGSMDRDSPKSLQ
jgi:hypothetical protein